MSRKDYFYGRKHFRGLGRSYFLKVIQLAEEGSSNRRLLGSVVDEIDYGFFGGNEAPKPEHYYDEELIITKMVESGLTDRSEAVIEQELAALEYSLSVKRIAGGDITANFPGLPAEAGLDVDYDNLREVVIKFGEGTKRYYIRRGLFEELYDEFDGDDTRIHPRMDDDKMMVNSIIVARNFAQTVSFKREAGAEFDARAEELSGLGASLRIKKTSERSYKVKFSGTRDYLIALSGIQWSKLD